MERQPYRSTPVFSEETLPAGLRRDHSLKAGTWGLLHVLSGTLRFTEVESGAATVLVAGETRIILPEELHFVEPVGQMEIRVDFFDGPPK